MGESENKNSSRFSCGSDGGDGGGGGRVGGVRGGGGGALPVGAPLFALPPWLGGGEATLFPCRVGMHEVSLIAMWKRWLVRKKKSQEIKKKIKKYDNGTPRGAEQTVMSKKQ